MLNSIKKVSWKDFTPSELSYHKKLAKWGTIEIATDFMVLDTETSHEDDKGWIYQWCFWYDGELIYGRKPSELAICLRRIKEANLLGKDRKLICYVHNASYDYTYFHNFVEMEFGQCGYYKALSIGTHNIISYTADGMEFRDSLKVASKSLASWAKELVTKHNKLCGEIDYKVVRYQDTPLGRKDWRYMFYDVVVLRECVEKQMENHGDHTWTIPYTITGYPRRDAFKSFRKDEANNRKRFLRNRLSYVTYMLCREEFSGGITHGNRFYAEQTVRVKDLRKIWGNDVMICHRDFASHYPSQQITKTAPSGPFALTYQLKKDGRKWGIKELNDLAKRKCYLARILVISMNLKSNKITMPYAQYDKYCRHTNGSLNVIKDNGRILSLEKGGYPIVIVNEIDMYWLQKQYNMNFRVLEVYSAPRGPFPLYLTDLVKYYFIQKSECKLAEKKFMSDKIGEGFTVDDVKRMAEYRTLQMYTGIAKGKLNGIYGMTATDPVRSEIYEDEDGMWHKEHATEEEAIKSKLDQFYKSKKSFMEYPLGVWTTSWARHELMQFIEFIGYDRFLYCDTDSIFYISNPALEARIDKLNAQKRERNRKKGYYVTVGGKEVHFDQFESEPGEILAFRFMHAKCYGVELKNDKFDPTKPVSKKNRPYTLLITIAGVPARSGKTTREDELGYDLDNLTDGFVFTKCGGTFTKYCREGDVVAPRSELINGHWTELSQSAIIVEGTKEIKSLGLEDEIGMYVVRYDYYGANRD